MVMSAPARSARGPVTGLHVLLPGSQLLRWVPPDELDPQLRLGLQPALVTCSTSHSRPEVGTRGTRRYLDPIGPDPALGEGADRTP